MRYIRYQASRRAYLSHLIGPSLQGVELILCAPDWIGQDGTFSPLKQRALKTCAENLVWGPNTQKKLQSIQDLRLSDDVIPDDGVWRSAVGFMHRVLAEEHTRALATVEAAVRLPLS